MMWSPPQIGRHRVAHFVSGLVGFAVLVMLPGCASFAGFGEPNDAVSTTALEKPVFDETPRVAASRSSAGMISAPRPFSWTPAGQTAGRRSFQIARMGNGGFHVLVVGSVGGDDPAAIALVDQLTRAMHQDSVILGGFQATVVRTLNPDGAATRSHLNALGEYINHGFPTAAEAVDADAAAAIAIPEARFLTQLCRSEQPQRVIHVRSVAGEQGLIGYGPETQKAGTEAARWLGFRALDMSQRAVEGSLERWLAETPGAGVIMFGIPESADRDTLWETYGDALLNFMMEDDLATRDLARRRSKSESADRRNDEFANP